MFPPFLFVRFAILLSLSSISFAFFCRSLTGETIVVEQPLVIVGDQIRSGPNAWGQNLRKDLKDLETFLEV